MTSTGERSSWVARGAALGGVLAVVLLAGLLMFDRATYRVTAKFINAGQLVQGNQVEIGGRPVGSVTAIKLSENGEAEVSMRVDGENGPLHEGTTAVIRATSLSGIANRYVSLSPGPDDAPEIADGGVIDADSTTSPVDLDQLFNTFDPRTRKALQNVIQGQARQFAGKGDRAGEALGYLNPALSTTSRLAQELTRDDGMFQRFVVDTSELVGALAERRGDLTELVGNAGATARAIGDENVALERALELLPGTLRKANTTFVNLRGTLDDLDPLVAESKPATRELATFFRRLRPLVKDARPTIADLRALVRAPGPDNDVTELTQKAPRLARLSSSVFPRAVRTLRRSQRVIEFIRPYAPELTGWLTKFSQGAANYDANGRYARVQPVFNSFELNRDPDTGQEVLDPIEPARRLERLEKFQDRRCPGGATQPPPDGSAPFQDEGSDCDPDSAPPGP